MVVGRAAVGNHKKILNSIRRVKIEYDRLMNFIMCSFMV